MDTSSTYALLCPHILRPSFITVYSFIVNVPRLVLPKYWSLVRSRKANIGPSMYPESGHAILFQDVLGNGESISRDILEQSYPPL